MLGRYLRPRRVRRVLNKVQDKLYGACVKIVYDRHSGFLAQCCAAAMQLLSYAFRALVALRHFLYDKRILRDESLGCLVVVVGNLVAGGTGKTPTVERFARVLHQRGRRVAILSRGYGAPMPSLWTRWYHKIFHGQPPAPKVVSDGEQIFLSAAEGGDEPYMLAKNLPGVVVLSCKDRVWAGQYAIRKFGVDTIVLDDAFQYLALHSQLKLLLIDKQRPFGNGFLLPRGSLREPIANIKRASYIFLTKSDGEPHLELKAKVRRYKPDAEFIECVHRPKFVKEVFGDGREGLEKLKGAKVAMFSAIATPESFENSLRECGAEIVFRKDFVDHHYFTQKEMRRVFKRASQRGAEFVITTEKDSVRIAPEWNFGNLPLYYLRIEARILRGVEDFEEAVWRVCFPGLSQETINKKP